MNKLNLNLYLAVVENNKDSDNLGRLQARILPGMKDAQPEHLPWVRPFLINGASKQSLCIPHEKDHIWCFFMDEDFKEGFYMKSQAIDKLVDFESVKSDLSNIAEISEQNTPDVSFVQYEDGTIHFHNSSTGESGVYHSSGSYTIFDKTGNVAVYTAAGIHLYNENANIKIEDDGTITQDNKGNEFKIGPATFELGGNSKSLVTYGELNAILNAMIGALDVRVYIDPLTGITGTVNPVPNMQLSTTIVPTLGGVPIPAALPQMESTKVKTS